MKVCKYLEIIEVSKICYDTYLRFDEAHGLYNVNER